MTFLALSDGCDVIVALQTAVNFSDCQSEPAPASADTRDPASVTKSRICSTGGDPGPD